MEPSALIPSHIAGDKSLNEVQVVEFSLSENKYAITLFDVREIVESIRITPLPHASVHIKGIIDLRGEITTIVDLKSLLHITKNAGEGQEDSRFIVLDESITSSKTGILVDDVTSVLTVSSTDIDQTIHNGDDGSHILGIIKKSSDDRSDSKKELIIWLDVKALLENTGIN